MRPPPPDALPAVAWLAGVWQRVGWAGVDLFFVLSGFLVSGLLFAEYRRHGSLRIGRFLIRRGFKIYPAFYVLLAATVAVELSARTFAPATAVTLLAEATYLQGYVAHYWSHTWSLAIEEHFYVVLPLALLCAWRWTGSLERLGGRLTAIVVTLALATLVLRFQAWMDYERDHTRYLLQTHLRLDSLAWGVVLGYLYHFHHDGLEGFVRRRRIPIALASAALLAVPFVAEEASGPLFTAGMLGLSGGFSGLLLLALLHPFARRDAPPPPHRRAGHLGGAVAAIGVYSYSIYLWHIPGREWILVHLEEAGFFNIASPTLAYLLNVGVFAFSSIAVGILLAHAVERPALALRDRLFPSRSQGLAGEVTDPARAAASPPAAAATRRTSPAAPA